MEQKSINSDIVWSRASVESCLYCEGKPRKVSSICAEDFYFGNVPGYFNFLQCSICDSLWLSDRLDSLSLPLAYSTYYTHDNTGAMKPPVHAGIRDALKNGYITARFGGGGGLRTQLQALAYRTLSRGVPSLEATYRFAPPAPARILDYGCGSGEYLCRMKALGNEVVGVEWDPVCVDQLRSTGVDVFVASEVPADEWRGKFDFITLNHVIEHVPDPVGLLGQLKSWLRPGGKVFIETPNALAEGLAVFGRYWRGLEAPRHLSLPSHKGLEIALEKAGLRSERQIVRGSIRHWLWLETLQAVPDDEKAAFEALASKAHPQSAVNTEFLTLIASADSETPSGYR